jgi:hypothetical protein
MPESSAPVAAAVNGMAAEFILIGAAVHNTICGWQCWMAAQSCLTRLPVWKLRVAWRISGMQ